MFVFAIALTLCATLSGEAHWSEPPVGLCIVAWSPALVVVLAAGHSIRSCLVLVVLFPVEKIGKQT